jgi:hypothetical protein
LKAFRFGTSVAEVGPPAAAACCGGKEFRMNSNDLKKRSPSFIRCNLCQRSYRARSRYDRFCKNCRDNQFELLRFADWLN